MGKGVLLCPGDAVKTASCLVGLFLDGVSENVLLLRPLIARRRVADVDHDDFAAEVHDLAAGDEGGVVAPRHLSWTEETGCKGWGLTKRPLATSDQAKGRDMSHSGLGRGREVCTAGKRAATNTCSVPLRAVSTVRDVSEEGPGWWER